MFVIVDRSVLLFVFNFSRFGRRAMYVRCYGRSANTTQAYIHCTGGGMFTDLVCLLFALAIVRLTCRVEQFEKDAYSIVQCKANCLRTDLYLLHVLSALYM